MSGDDGSSLQVVLGNTIDPFNFLEEIASCQWLTAAPIRSSMFYGSNPDEGEPQTNSRGFADIKRLLEIIVLIVQYNSCLESLMVAPNPINSHLLANWLVKN